MDAASGEAALRVRETFPIRIDLLVTDVVIPLLSGRQLADELKRLQPDMRVLYMSGYTDEEVLRYGVDTSQVAFFRKPSPMIALLQKVREVLNVPAAG